MAIQGALEYGIPQTEELPLVADIARSPGRFPCGRSCTPPERIEHRLPRLRPDPALPSAPLAHTTSGRSDVHVGRLPPERHSASYRTSSCLRLDDRTPCLAF